MARHVVVGGAGFLGTALCRALLERGDEVICVDDLSTGARSNIEPLRSDAGFTFLEHDACTPFTVAEKLDGVFHMASPASPPDYLALPLETLRVGSQGTLNLLDLALAHDARFLVTSTSEVYGDPLQHPQTESYWGNVNPIGPRSVYDEAKRFAEAATVAHRRTLGTDARIARICNTYGPGMRPDDGRVVSNFILQTLRGDDLTIYGDGTQTRSFCFVDDQVRGLLALFDSPTEQGPINIGNPVEFTILELAEIILDLVGGTSRLRFEPLPVDDPMQRCPDITLATERLGWTPMVPLEAGLRRTIDHFRAGL